MSATIALGNRTENKAMESLAGIENAGMAYLIPKAIVVESPITLRTTPIVC